MRPATKATNFSIAVPCDISEWDAIDCGTQVRRPVSLRVCCGPAPDSDLHYAKRRTLVVRNDYELMNISVSSRKPSRNRQEHGANGVVELAPIATRVELWFNHKSFASTMLEYAIAAPFKPDFTSQKPQCSSRES